MVGPRYGFSAWLCNWHKALAELVKSANLPMFMPSAAAPSTSLLAPFTELTVIAPLDTVPTPKEKLLPQHRLHHPGYYYLHAAKYAAERQARARLIPETSNHDSYLCFEPDEEATLDHAKIEEDLLRLAMAEFESRGQARTVASIQYQIACLQMAKAQQTADVDLWRDAGSLFATVARQYRKDRWPGILQEVLTRRLYCATEAGDQTGILAAQLELLEKRFNRSDGDLMNCLRGMAKGGEKTTLVLRAGDFVDFRELWSVCLSSY
jgi:trafficking protein particle complex subunit 11